MFLGEIQHRQPNAKDTENHCVQLVSIPDKIHGTRKV